MLSWRNSAPSRELSQQPSFVESEQWCGVSVCVLDCVPSVAGSLSQANVVCDVAISDSDCEFVKPQTFSFSSKRNASVALECETKMNIEGPPVQAVPEAVTRRPTPQSVLSKVVPECVRSRAPPPEGTGCSVAWPTKPPTEVDEMEVEDLKPDLKFDANDAWNPRERVITRVMENYLTKISEEMLAEVGELEAYLLCPTVVTEKGAEGLFSSKQSKGIRCRHETVCDHASKNGTGLPVAPRDHRVHKHEAGDLLATMERKHTLTTGAPEELREKLFPKVRVLDDRILEEEHELFEKRVEMEEPLKERRRTKAEEWRA